MNTKRQRLSLEEYQKGVIAGNRIVLSRAITLIESELPEDKALAAELIDACLPQTGNSIRIGITGVPGVGKSTFINAIGTYLLEQERKLAVLAIDPSSLSTRGSIMGDKTRMNQLALDGRAFVRPSPSSGSLGGVSKKTRETIFLCEAAGYDTIIVETVGVGQSELAVKRMTDFFLLLLLPNAGDELQGLKRGIMEMADALFVNKADGEYQKIAAHSKQQYSKALHLLAQYNKWKVPVLTGSALEKIGLEDCWQHILDYKAIQEASGFWEQNRLDQVEVWFDESLQFTLSNLFDKDPWVQERMKQLRSQLHQEKRSPYKWVKELIDGWRKL